MKVHVWTNPDAPAGHFALARIQYPQGGWAPVLIHAGSEQVVREKAEAWWQDQLSHHQNQAARKRKAKPAPPPVVEEEAI